MNEHRKEIISQLNSASRLISAAHKQICDTKNTINLGEHKDWGTSNEENLVIRLTSQIASHLAVLQETAIVAGDILRDKS